VMAERSLDIYRQALARDVRVAGRDARVTGAA